MKQAIKKYLDVEVDKMTDKMLKEKIKQLNLKYEEKPSLTGVAKGFNRGVAIATIFKACEVKLIQPIFITDFPKETTVLAKIHRDDPTLVERFEPYIAGFEIGNAYSELNDPILQQEFFEIQKKAFASGDKEAHPMDKDWIEALEYGMPPTGGLGLGIDRMVMILTNTNSMREIIPFPTLKPKNG
jgi:lysyl-tRNA synthetase class 2